MIDDIILRVYFFLQTKHRLKRSRGRKQKIIDSLNEYAKFNQILNLIREILLNDLNEKMNGLGEQKNTIMQQSNSLLEECKKLDELVNTTSTQDFSPILEKKK